jgi:hypothetical protein
MPMSTAASYGWGVSPDAMEFSASAIDDGSEPVDPIEGITCHPRSAGIVGRLRPLADWSRRRDREVRVTPIDFRLISP